MGGEAPKSKNGVFFKAEGLFLGCVGKIRNNLNFRIIGQGIIYFYFKIIKL